MRIRVFIVGAIVAASMSVFAVPASAQTASDGYSPGPRGSIQERISTERTPNPDPPAEITETRSSEASELPFTGLDVAALFVVGAALAVAGYLLWRRSRTETGEVGAA